MSKFLFVFCVFLFPQIATADDVSDVQQELKKHYSFKNPYIVERTVVNDIYAIRTRGAPKEACGLYVNKDVTMIANHKGALKWYYIENEQEISESDYSVIRKNAYDSAMKLQLPLVKNGVGDAKAVLLSGFDCGPSQRMEEYLAKNKLNYYLLGSFLKSKASDMAERAMCSTNPVDAWKNRQIGIKKTPSCTYDSMIAKDIGCVTSGRGYPTAILPDGKIANCCSLDGIPLALKDGS